MAFTPNPNFERDLERMVQGAATRLVENLNQVLQRFSVEYGGLDIAVVKPALAEAWASTNDGARIGEPGLTQCATAVSNGGRIWIDERGHVMVDDGQ